jgi:hypothetical protein
MLIMFAGLLVAMAAGAQTLTRLSAVPLAFRNFDPRPEDRPLRCAVTPMPPALNFGFRFQAGYMVRVPMNQYRGASPRWAILTEITPEGGAPVLLASRMRLPQVPETKVEFEVGGGYLLGQGRYYVKWALWDDSGRVCRKSWTINAHPRGAERNLKIALPPQTVSDFSLRGIRRTTPAAEQNAGDTAPIRLTLLLNVAPLSPRRIRLRGEDRIMLLGTLATLLERLPTRSVRLVVFNLDQQRELFRDDAFTLDGLDNVAQSISQLELGSVNYHVLQKPQGYLDLLASVVNREIGAQPTADAVLFLGPLARFTGKFPAAWLGAAAPASQHFFYFQYRPVVNPQLVWSDSISQAVTQLHGKTYVIHSPVDFAKAIAQLEYGGAGSWPAHPLP